MNKTRKNIAINVTPIHQFFFNRNRVRSGAILTIVGCEVGADSDWEDILNSARFRICFTLVWLQP
jgi:hypothetical protein